MNQYKPLDKKISKVLIVTTAFPRYEGDSQAPYLLEAALAIQAIGIQVRILAMHVPGSKTFEVIDQVEVYRPRYFFEKLEILRKDPAGLPEYWKRHFFGRLLLIPFLITHAVNLLRLCKDVDIIHANWTLSGMVAWGTRFLHRKPIVLTIHGSDVLRIESYKIVRKFTAFIIRQIDGIICVSNSLVQKIQEWGVSPQYITVIPDGVNIRKFSPSHFKRSPIILYVGSLTENKGIHVLINAFKIISTNIPDYKLQIVGDGYYVKELVKLVRELELEDRIEFTGAQPQTYVADMMRKASILVLPSLSEGLGVVLLEALASGTPVVGTNIGGIPDVITPEVGMLVPPGNPRALAQGLLELITKLPKVDYSTAARKRIEEYFSWDIVVRQIITFYERILNRK